MFDVSVSNSVEEDICRGPKVSGSVPLWDQSQIQIQAHAQTQTKWNGTVGPLDGDNWRANNCSVRSLVLLRSLLVGHTKNKNKFGVLL